MKKLFLSIQIVILISSLIFSQTEWEYIGLADPNIGDIFDIEIDDNGNIYAGTLLGPIYKSSDNGVTWELKNNGLPANAAIGEDIAINQNQIYLVTNQGLYKSTNGGDNWFRIAQSIPFLDFDQVSVIPNGYIFTSVFNMGTGGVFRSTDEGATWQPTGYTGFGALDIGINSNGVMFLGNGTASWFGIQRSSDLGMNWQWVLPYIAATALEYLNDGSVLAGAIESPYTVSGIYKTTDNGSTWFNTNTFTGMNMFFDFVLDTNNDIYVSNGLVYLSTDNGSSWEYRGLANLDVNCFAIDSSGYVYAGTLTNGIFRTPGRTTPVELVSFSANVNEKDVELSWITATELNNAGFEILRFTQNDNNGWEKIEFIQGGGTTTESTVYSYVDKNLSPGSYNYRLKQIDYDGSYQYYNLNETIEIINQFSFTLEQNFPNPFNPTTKIKYSIPSVIASGAKQSQFVTLKVYDVLGNEVAILVNEEKPAGSYEIVFTAGKYPSGVYYFQLTAGEFVSTKKMILLK